MPYDGYYDGFCIVFLGINKILIIYKGCSNEDLPFAVSLETIKIIKYSFFLVKFTGSEKMDVLYF